MMMSDGARSLNPAASKSRMVVALAVLLVLGLLSWFTIDASAVVHVQGYSSRFLSYDGREVPVRWIPLVLLGLFSFRVVMAHLRARVEVKPAEEGL